MLEVVHSFNIRSYYIPFDDIMSLQKWVSRVFSDKKYHVLTNVEQEMRVMSDLIPRSEVMHCLTGAHILLISFGEIRRKK